MISSLIAASAGNPITDSLRVAEVSLEHFFSDSNTRLVIARICDIAENRGGVVSIIEDQIRKQDTVILPCADAQTWLVSKYTAAEFILQTLVEANKNSFHKKVFVCEAGPPIRLIEVAKKLAELYGLRLWSDLVIKYSAQSDVFISILPQKMLPSPSTYSSDIKVATENADVTGEEIKSIFKDFVFATSNTLACQDWEMRTRELIRLCGPDLSMGKP